MSNVFGSFNSKYSIIGTSDRGMTDREDKLLIKNEALKKGLTAEEAESFAKNTPGAELLVKQEDGTFSVYELSTSEKGKNIENRDFEDGNINISKDALEITGGTKAYVSTSTNYIRTFENAGIALDFLEDDFITADLNLNIKDLDGIDSNSAKDLKGSLKGKINLDYSLIDYSLKQAEKQTGLEFGLSASPKNNSYKINVSYGVGLGNITLKPQNDGSIKADIGGLAGAIAGTADIVVDVGEAVKKTLNSLGKDMGFKVSYTSATEYTLSPDLTSNALLKEIPLGIKDTKIKVEEINLKPGNIITKVDQYGNLNLEIKNAEVIASSDSKAPVMKTPDPEGPDQVTVNVHSELANDLEIKVNSSTGLKVDIQKKEQAGFSEQLKKYSGQELEASGKFELKDIKVNTVLDAGGKLKDISSDTGTVDIDKLNITMDKTSIFLDSANANLKPVQDGSKIKLGSDDAMLKGSVTVPGTKLDITELQLAGEFIYDKNDTRKIVFAAGKNKGISFSGKINSTEGRTAINGLKLIDSDITFDLAGNNLDIKPKSAGGNISVKSISLPGQGAIYGLSTNGALRADLNKGSFSLESSKLKMSANLGDVSLTYLNGSANIDYNPVTGIDITKASIVAAGKIGDFEIKKISGSGDMRLSPTGQVEFSNTKNLLLETNIGLKVKGNLKISHPEKTFLVETTGVKPAIIDFKAESGDFELKGVEFRGKASFNEENYNLNFSSFENQPLEISSGTIGKAEFSDVNLKNGSIDVQPDTGSFSIKPLPGKNFEFDGKLPGFNFKALESSGTVAYNPHKQTISWDKEVKGSLPEFGIENLSTTGPVSLKISSDGTIILDSKDSTINAGFSGIELKDLKLNGQLVYNPKTGSITVNGKEAEGMKIKGRINGRDVEAVSSGFFTMKENNGKLEFSGEKIKINGVIDGFSLESPEGVSGKLVTDKNFQKIDLKDLKFNINVEGVEFKDNEGLLTVNENGYEINLSGNAALKKEKLSVLLDRFASHEDFSASVKSSIEQVQHSIESNFSGFGNTAIIFEDLKLNFDKNFNFSNFNVNAAIEVSDAEIKANTGKEAKNISLGDIRLTARAGSDDKGFAIKDGLVEFNLNQDLRSFIAAYAKTELENAGFRDVELSIMPNGDVSVENATFVNRKNMFNKEKVKGIKMKLEIDTRIENNNLVISLDKFKMKNIFAEAINKTIGGKKFVSDEVDKALTAEDIKFQRNDKNEFSIDLNSLLRSKLGEGLTLKDLQLGNDGLVKIAYLYQN